MQEEVGEQVQAVGGGGGVEGGEFGERGVGGSGGGRRGRRRLYPKDDFSDDVEVDGGGRQEEEQGLGAAGELPEQQGKQLPHSAQFQSSRRHALKSPPTKNLKFITFAEFSQLDPVFF